MEIVIWDTCFIRPESDPVRSWQDWAQQTQLCARGQAFLHLAVRRGKPKGAPSEPSTHVLSTRPVQRLLTALLWAPRPSPYHQVELSQTPCSQRPEPRCPPSPNVVLPLSLALAPQDPCPRLHSRADLCCGKACQPATLRVRPMCRARPHPLCLDSLGDALGHLFCPFLSEWAVFIVFALSVLALSSQCAVNFG